MTLADSLCRRRRVKCDEAKPACHRCINGGRQCDGYAVVPRKNGNSNSKKGVVFVNYVAPPPELSLWSFDANQKEHLSLDFFRNVTAAQVSLKTLDPLVIMQSFTVPLHSINALDVLVYLRSLGLNLLCLRCCS